jgi:hypothetical protein
LRDLVELVGTGGVVLDCGNELQVAAVGRQHTNSRRVLIAWFPLLISLDLPSGQSTFPAPSSLDLILGGDNRPIFLNCINEN